MKSIMVSITPVVRVFDDGSDIEIDLSQLPNEIRNGTDEDIKEYVLENINSFSEYSEAIAELKSRILDDQDLQQNNIIDIEDLSLDVL